MANSILIFVVEKENRQMIEQTWWDLLYFDDQVIQKIFFLWR